MGPKGVGRAKGALEEEGVFSETAARLGVGMGCVLEGFAECPSGSGLSHLTPAEGVFC